MASPITGTNVMTSPLGNMGAFTDYTNFSDGACWTDMDEGNTLPVFSEGSSYAIDGYCNRVIEVMNKRFLE